MNKKLRSLLLALLALVLTVCVAAILIVRLTLAPAAGEWSTRLRLGPYTFDASVPATIRLATSSWVAPLLDGRALDTRYGIVRLAWLAERSALELRCAPCTATVTALGTQPLRVAQLVATVRRDGNALAGQLEVAPVGTGEASLQGRWEGRLGPKAMPMQFELQEAPITQWYAVLAPGLPELQQGRISGRMALRGQITLPDGAFMLQPRIAQFNVEGLGTQEMLGARSGCGAPSRLTKDSWLARTVIAAEDQRFFTHPGYDLTELMASLDANQKRDQVERGGSTLSQQLARLLVTGSERSAQRKLRELLYAVEMEQTLGKARILQLYLDNAPWGARGLCGAEAAAVRYFGRPAARLEPAQAVWLAAMLNNPQHAVDQWQREGHIDAARVRWVAEGVRGIARPQREALLKSVANASFAAPKLVADDTGGR